ncbi:uncharacterized protein Z519_01332 [Cladophialophora bantiana CBS 173.52]|uniref:Cytochrome P450 n=1 Tax=Cladophialophora bantiana (strain ATCC 10958 / CBS 173.52 / CDC B-1940 / NIH 8579) TaxID=1442370 RepID=A0A0D2HWJ9_CLAB1|nr:uncharacterized protein Z519_01332 [Cladophialophora bantiana CBS 173.52]KIW97748.1 hypothetical protein Z519_01332 [Cladophialophora bantiana CBS 173.52]
MSNYLHLLSMTPVAAAVAAIGTGLVWHAVYNRHEPTIRSFTLDFLRTMGVFAGIAFLGSQNPKSTMIAVITFPLVELSALGLSISVYRLFFHPLRQFPGPYSAKLTKWTGAYWASTGKLHEIIPALHEKYGDIVRIGPNELSFGDANSIKYLHGPQGSRLPKGPYHDGSVYGSSGVAMPNSRDWYDHKVRRRMWDHGFTQNQLKSYEPRVIALLEVLCARLKEFDGQVIDLRCWLDYVTFDVMGDLAFSKSFGLLNDDGPRYYSKAIRSGLRLRNIISNVPWMSPVAYLLPMNKDFKEYAGRFKALSKQSYKERRAKGTVPNDIFTHILAGNKDGVKTKERDVEADAPILIIAGSDTSSITSTFTFYFIARDKIVYSRLRNEVDHALKEKPIASELLNKCPYLNGAIYEALRIWPPGPNHQQRRTLDGAWHDVDGVAIPPQTQVATHVLTVQRSPKNFTKPLEFVPERWDDTQRDPTWNHNPQAWIPFQTGAYACAGKQLALNELRLLVAMIVHNFDVILQNDFDHEAFESSIQSFQSLVMGPLPVLIKSRVADGENE